MVTVNIFGQILIYFVIAFFLFLGICCLIDTWSSAFKRLFKKTEENKKHKLRKDEKIAFLIWIMSIVVMAALHRFTSIFDSYFFNTKWGERLELLLGLIAVLGVPIIFFVILPEMKEKREIDKKFN